MPNDFLSEEYAVTVDYGSSIANLISRYGYTLTNHAYSERGFKSNDTRNSGIVLVKIVVFQFRGRITSEEIPAQFFRFNGYRSATLKELMALGNDKTNPPIYNLNNIVSLNRIQNPFGGLSGYPQLFSPRHLGVIWDLSGSATTWRFAAVKTS
jgi:hypothetical protein